MPLIRTSISACLRLFTCTVCLCPFAYIQVSFYLPTRVTVHMYVYRCPYVSVLLCVCPSTFELLSVRLCDCLYNPGHLHASVALGSPPVCLSVCVSIVGLLLHSPSAIYIPRSATTTTSSVNTRTTRKRQTDRHSERESVPLQPDRPTGDNSMVSYTKPLYSPPHLTPDSTLRKNAQLGVRRVLYGARTAVDRRGGLRL